MIKMIPDYVLQTTSEVLIAEFGPSATGACEQVAERAHDVLEGLGYDTSISIGSAAIRVGKSDGSIACWGHPDIAEVTPGEKHHCWLERGPFILDFTPFTFRALLNLLDRHDGKTSDYKLKGDYIYMLRSKVTPFIKVRQGHKVGAAYYKAYNNIGEHND